jgi:serine/threonine protein kinase
VLKYSYVNLDNETNEIILITELANSLKSSIKRMPHPKLKVIRGWCAKILDGLEYLVSHGITQVNLSADSIYIEEEKDIKIGDLIIDSKFKHSQRFSKKKTLITDPSATEMLYTDESIIIYNFGKIVLYMLFHQPHVYKIILKLLQSSNSELLFN